MARIRKIRLTENDRKEYAKLVKNSKAKIRRTLKNYGIDLSGEIELPKLENFKSRKEFNKWKQQQSTFTNRANTHYQFVKNDYGVVASKHEIYEIKENTKKAQRNAKKERERVKDKQVFVNGKPVGTVGEQLARRKQPNTVGTYIPEDFDFSKVRNRRRLETIKEGMERKVNPKFYDKRKRTLQENFLSTISEFFNSDGDDLVSRMREINPDDFYEMFLMFDEFKFEYYYPDETGEPDAVGSGNFHKLEKYVDWYYEGKIDFKLQDFPSRL